MLFHQFFECAKIPSHLFYLKCRIFFHLRSPQSDCHSLLCDNMKNTLWIVIHVFNSWWAFIRAHLTVSNLLKQESKLCRLTKSAQIMNKANMDEPKCSLLTCSCSFIPISDTQGLRWFFNLSQNSKYFITFRRRVSKLIKNAFSLDFGHWNRFSYFGTDEGTKR